MKVTNAEDTLPMMLAPVRQLGLQVAFGLRGCPSNRIVLIYGPPGGGKSSIFFHLSGEYLRNDDEVWLRETEHALDRIYYASYLPADLTGDELIKESLLYWKKRTEAHIKKDAKAKEEDKTIGPNQLEIMNQRLTDIGVILSEIKAGVTKEDTSLPIHRRRNLLRNAVAEYKLRKISIEHPRTLEDFETEMISEIEKKLADPERKFKRLLIGVDSVSYLLPKEDVEKATSSDGRSLMSAKYLHTLMPRLLGRISGHEITLVFIVQQTTHIKMNPYESSSPIGNVQGKGGLAVKFGATFMIGAEQKAKTNNVEGEEVKTGILHIPKAKLRGGGQGPGEGRFYLRESAEESAIDFNEPMVMEVLNSEKLGILKRRGRHFVPGNMLRTHPRFEADILPKLKPIPKKKEEEEDGTPVDNDTPETAVNEGETPKVEDNTPSTKRNYESLFYSGYAAEIMPMLLETPKFHELVYDLYDVVEAV